MVWYGRVGAGYGANLLIHGAESCGGLGAITMLTGKKNNHFELNAGAFIIEEGIYFTIPILNIGYRLQKPSGGFVFRANASLLGLGVSFRYAF